ncbi:MAG: hypothetical protein M5U31_15860 [Acidimicrobiia bacterium]|nr:hypothetical protein [Acidimicrobiia bacterium]
MVLVASLLVGLVILAVAFLVVLREARSLEAEPTPPVFNIDEAFEWVVEHVPDEVAATLTPDDVYRILSFQTEFFALRGVAVNGSSVRPADGVVIGVTEAVEHVMERATATGDSYLPEQVLPVVEVLLAYLQEIGAVGPAAGRAITRRGRGAGDRSPRDT